jgi:hypothetical protein
LGLFLDGLFLNRFEIGFVWDENDGLTHTKAMVGMARGAAGLAERQLCPTNDDSRELTLTKLTTDR